MNLYESKKLREERASVVKEMHELSAVIKNEDRNFTAEESEKFDRMDKAQEDLQERAEASSRIEKVEGLDCNIPQSQNKEYRSNPIITEDDKQNACKGWLLRAGGQDHLNKGQYTEAASKCGLNMNSNTMDVSLRAQSTTTTEGGHGINLSMFEGFDEVLLAHGGVRAAAKRINTSDGGARHFATIDDTAVSANIVGENTDATNDSITFGSVSVPVYTYVTEVFPVSVELIQDSEMDIMSFVVDALGTRLARATNAHFTTGDGTAKPNGLVARSTEGTVADGTATFDYENIVTLMHSVDPSYRNSASCGWMFNDTVLRDMKLLVDSDARPLWNSSLAGIAGGYPDQLLGKPFHVNNDMVVNNGANDDFIIFGDFSRYIVRDVGTVQVQVLHELLATKRAVAILAYMRTGGNLLNTGAVKHMSSS